MMDVLGDAWGGPEPGAQTIEPLPGTATGGGGSSTAMLDAAVKQSFARADAADGTAGVELLSSGAIPRALLMEFFAVTAERMAGEEVRAMLLETVASVHKSLAAQGVALDEPRGAHNVSQNIQAKIVLVQWEELKKLGVDPEWGYTYLFKRNASNYIEQGDADLHALYDALKQKNTQALTMAIIGPEAMKFTLKIEEALKPILAAAMELPLDELTVHLDEMASDKRLMIAVATMQAKQQGGPPVVSAFLQTLSESTALRVMEFVNLKRWQFAKQDEVAEAKKYDAAAEQGLQVSGTIPVEKLREAFAAIIEKTTKARTKKKLRAYFLQIAKAKSPSEAQKALQEAVIKIQMDVLKTVGIFGEWGYKYIYNRKSSEYIEDGDAETMELFMRCKGANSAVVEFAMMGKELAEKRTETTKLMEELTPQLAAMSAKQRRKFKEKLMKKCGPLMKKMEPMTNSMRIKVMNQLGPQETKNFQTLQILMGYDV